MAEVRNPCLLLDQARQASKILKLYVSQHGILSSGHMSPDHTGVIHSEKRTQGIVILEQILRVSINEPLSEVDSNSARCRLFLPHQSCNYAQRHRWLSSGRKSLLALGASKSRPDQAAFLVDSSHPFVVHKFSVYWSLNP